MFRTRFKKGILAEFLPAAGRGRKDKVIILCDGMPSIPRKQPLVNFLSSKGYWVFYPRYRGAWESGGKFLEHSPHEDILHVIDELPKGFTELAFGQRFSLSPRRIFVIGGSFGGAAAILSSLDPRVNKAIANCPVVDWAILGEEQKLETSNPSYPDYIRQAWGDGYRLQPGNWEKLQKGNFFNPAFHAEQITPSKVMIFHAVDDPYIPYQGVKDFALRSGVKLKTLRRGGHVGTEYVVQKYWAEIRRFFDSAR